MRPPSPVFYLLFSTRARYTVPTLQTQFNRRQFLATTALTSMAACVSCRLTVDGRRTRTGRLARFFFVSQGRTALINADGTGLRYLEFDIPNQATWQPADFFSDGHRVLFLSMEPRRDGPGRPFDEFYTQTPTHLVIHDLDSGSLKEIASPTRAKGCLMASISARTNSAWPGVSPVPQDTRSGPATSQAATESRSPASPVICTSGRCGRRMAFGWPTRIASQARTRATTGRTF